MTRPLFVFLVLIVLGACTVTKTDVATVPPTQTIAALESTAVPTTTPVPTEVPTTATALPTETPLSLAAPAADTSTVSEWVTHIMDLYPLQLRLPTNWTIIEINRRVEPTDGGLVLGHDCADYTIANAEGTLQMSLMPACGLGEGGNFLCPPDTVIIGPALHSDAHMVRFYGPSAMTYGYTESGSELMYCADSPRLSFIDGGVETYMLIEVDYVGNEAELPQFMEITDDIIRSITILPIETTAPTRSPKSAMTLCVDVTEIPSIECEALIEIYTQLEGQQWLSNDGWLQTTTPCAWDGVQCAHQHVTALSFHFTGLMGDMPAEIGDLTHLTTLYLWGNGLRSLPPEIGYLTNLTELNLGVNNLSNLPSEIGQLTNLTELDLAENNLSNLPSEIGQLTNLNTLQLASNSLSTLPPEIGQLTNLTTLGLYNNRLDSLPPEIGNLTNLTHLYLFGNNLDSLPPEIGNLTSLTYLGLEFNGLSSLPPEIGNLTSLTELDLWGNDLSSLPPEISTLVSLTWLNLEGNNLSSLPPELCSAFAEGVISPVSLCSP